MPSERTDPLFDPEPFEKPGSTRRKRSQRKASPYIKLFAPWVICRRARQEPKAHLPHEKIIQDRMEHIVPRCNEKLMLAVLDMPGEYPLVAACPTCLKVAKMERIPTQLWEEP